MTMKFYVDDSDKFDKNSAVPTEKRRFTYDNVGMKTFWHSFEAGVKFMPYVYETKLPSQSFFISDKDDDGTDFMYEIARIVERDWSPFYSVQIFSEIEGRWIGLGDYFEQYQAKETVESVLRMMGIVP